jgi:predicted TIM-barrel fold metal-dependent hydrolase
MLGKVIGFEEHYKLPAVQEANRDNPGDLVYDVWKKAGRFETDAQGGWPAGIYDLAEGRIAATDAAGIDVQILSHTSPGPETLEPSLAIDLATQANDDVAAAVSKYPERFLGFATLPMRKEYLRENFYGGILAGDFANQESGAVDGSWSLSYNAYLGMVNLIGIDRVLFTTDYPYANMKAARQFVDQMPINLGDKEKIAHLNAERLLGLKG